MIPWTPFLVKFNLIYNVLMWIFQNWYGVWGKVKLSENGTRNWLAEAVGNYTTNMKCTWVVEANRPNSRIRLHIKDFETECGWDHLYIWDGDNIFHGLQVSARMALGRLRMQHK